MKRFLSLALAAAMALSLVPATAFAYTYNEISKTVTVEEDYVLGSNGDVAPILTITDDNGDLAKEISEGTRIVYTAEATLGSTLETAVSASGSGANTALSATTATITVKDGFFARAYEAGEEVTSWFKGLPEDLEAKVKTAVAANATEMQVEFTGTTKDEIKEPTTIKLDVPPSALENKPSEKPSGRSSEPKYGSTSFELSLTGAEFTTAFDKGNITVSDENVEATFDKKTDSTGIVTLTSKVSELEKDKLKDKLNVEISLADVKVTDATAKVDVISKNSPVSNVSGLTFAKSVDAKAIVTADKPKNFSGAEDMNPIFIEEVTAGTFKAGDEVTLKLNSGFKFVDASSIKATIVSTDEVIEVKPNKDDNRTVTLVFPEDYKASSKAIIVKVDGIRIDEDGADFEDVAEITVRGTNVDKTTVEMGKYIDWGVKVSAEDKTLPTIYSGMTGNEDDSNETLKLTLKETAVDSWLTQRKTTLTFPEGVKVRGIEVDTLKGFKGTSKTDMAKTLEAGIDGNVVTISANTLSIKEGEKAELGLIFDLVVAPDFTGDIEVVAGGPALGATSEVAVAKAVAPITVEAEKTSVAIDYRNVNVGDITIKEAEAGLWRKGDTIVLSAENMQFEKGMKAEIVEGDGEIKKLDVKGGKITIVVDSESAKKPMTIKLTDASLYLDRTLPAGDYALSLVKAEGDEFKVKDALIFETYNGKDGNDPEVKDKFGFDVDEVVMVKDYVTVATAGRDQGTTFTTNVVVTIDSDKMIVDGQEVALDVPAFLSADGRTMLPVRAVTEALSDPSNTQPVDWIAGNPGTIMIYYGDKTVSMTLGSTTMYINGTPVPMTTAPVIVNDRAFLPMRDLGRALGLSDNQIEWDATARTATFNPVAEAK